MWINVCCPRQTGYLEQNCWADSKHKFSIRSSRMLLPLANQYQGKAQEALYIKTAGEKKQIKNLSREIATVTAVKAYRCYRKKQGYSSGGDTRHTIR